MDPNITIKTEEVKRLYATKTTTNAKITDEDFNNNIQKAKQIALKLQFLDDLRVLYEDLAEAIPLSPKLKKKKIDDSELEDDDDDFLSVAEINDDIEYTKNYNKYDNNNNNNNNNINGNNDNDSDNDNNNDNNNNNNNYFDDAHLSNYGEGSSSNPVKQNGIKSKKRKDNPSNTTNINTNTNGIHTEQNNNVNNKTENTDNKDNKDNKGNNNDETKHKTRSQMKKKNKVITATTTKEILDTSLLRPCKNHPQLTNPDPRRERAYRSLGHLVSLVNVMRLDARASPYTLPLSTIAEQSELKKTIPLNNQNPDTMKIIDHVHRRPFLNEIAIKKFRQHSQTLAKKFGLQEGDIIHMPFSKNEKTIAEKVRQESASNEEWIAKLVLLLPGRALDDCTRYTEVCNAGVSYIIDEPIIYHPPRTHTNVVSKNISRLLQQREMPNNQNKMLQMNNETRRRQMPLYQHVSVSAVCSGATVDVKFDPSGLREKLLVGCAKNQGADSSNFSLLYDLKTGKSTTLDKHKDTVPESQFSLDGKRLFTAGWSDSAINVWDSDTAEFIIDLVEVAGLGTGWTPARIAIHREDPSIVASCSKSDDDTSVYVWRLKDEVFGKEDVTFSNLTTRISLPGYLHEMDFSRGRFSHLLVGGSDHKEERRRNGKVFITAPGKAVVFDIQTSTCIRQISPHTKQISCVRTSPCGSQFVTGSSDGTMAMIENGNVVQTFHTYQPDITVVTYSNCGKFVTAAGEDNRIFVYDTRNNKIPLHTLEHEKVKGNDDHDGVSSSIWTNYGNLLITGGEDNAVRVWDIRLAQPQIHSMTAHNCPSDFYKISKNDQLLASGGLDWQVCLYSQVSSTDSTLNPCYKLSQALLSEMSNANVSQ